jgi:uncharacterized protein
MGNVRKFSILVLAIVGFSLTNHRALTQVKTGRAMFNAYSDSLNRVFFSPETSILDSAALTLFKGIPFYEYDSSYCVKAKFRKIYNAKPREMATSGARRPVYVPIGTIRFKVNGKKQKLTLFINQKPSKPEYANHVMLAFGDLTNGFDTYGGGRYLDLVLEELKRDMIIDFNFSYNPYCAYLDKYACVIPPAENFLNIHIKAGAMVSDDWLKKSH